MSSLRIELNRTSSLAHYEEFRDGLNSPNTPSDCFEPIFDLSDSRSLLYGITKDNYNDNNIIYDSSENESGDSAFSQHMPLKQGIVLIKHEVDGTGSYCTDRKWNQVTLNMEINKLTIDYGSKSKRRPSLQETMKLNLPLTEVESTEYLPSYSRSLTLKGAKLLPSEDYLLPTPHTFRVLLRSREQFLIQSDSAELAWAWAKAFQTTINVASGFHQDNVPLFGLHQVVSKPQHFR